MKKEKQKKSLNEIELDKLKNSLKANIEVITLYDKGIERHEEALELFNKNDTKKFALMIEQFTDIIEDQKGHKERYKEWNEKCSMFIKAYENASDEAKDLLEKYLGTK